MRSQSTIPVAPSPDRLAEPPPLELVPTDAHRIVGWVRGSVIGFRGFRSELDAVHAAWIAHRTLARRLARERNRRPIATLVRSGDSGPGPVNSFGFELPIPPPVDGLRLRALAQLVYRTLRKSGVRWGMWARQERRPRARVASPAAGRQRRSGRLTFPVAGVAALWALVLVPILAMGPVTERMSFGRLGALSLAALAGAALVDVVRWVVRRRRSRPKM